MLTTNQNLAELHGTRERHDNALSDDEKWKAVLSRNDSFDGVFVFDQDAKAEFILSIIRSLLARLHATGGPPPGGLPMAMVGAASAVHATGAAAAETIGPDTPLRVLPVPVTLPWPRIVDRLNTLQAPCLIGYPSALARLAAEQRAHGLHIAPAVIISTGETLLPEARAEITAALGTPVINTFASTEGLINSSAPGGASSTIRPSRTSTSRGPSRPARGSTTCARLTRSEAEGVAREESRILSEALIQSGQRVVA